VLAVDAYVKGVLHMLSYENEGDERGITAIIFKGF